MRGLLAPLIKLIVFLIVTTLATYVLATTISNASYGNTNSYKADFTDASGLQVGDDVRIAGVRVGTVSDISIVHHDTARVTFTVDKSRPLPTSTLAYLRYRNLVGQRYVDIEQGPGDSNATLKPGAVIPESQTKPAVDLTVLFQGFQPLFQGLDADQINKLSGALIAALQGEGGSLQLLFQTLGDLSNSLADKDQLIGDVITNLSQLLTTVGNHSQQLNSLIIELKDFFSGLAQDRSTIGNAISGINDLATNTANLLTNVRGPLAQDIVDLTGLVGNLNKGSDVVTYVLQQMAPTMAGLMRVASYGSWFNFYMCSVSGTITLPGGTQTLHLGDIKFSDAPRCSS